jgi:hypothetical protein
MTGQIIIFPQRKGGAAHAMTYKNSSAARQARWSNCEAISLVRDIDLGDDSTAKFILIAIAMFPNWGELSCEVTDKEIAAITHYSPRTITNGIKRLADHRLIQVSEQVRGGAGKFGSRRITITPPPLASDDTRRQHLTTSPSASDDNTLIYKINSNSARAKATDRSKTETPLRGQTARTAKVVSIAKPVSTPPTPIESKDAPAAGFELTPPTPRINIAARFESFWRVFPHRAGDDPRAPAEKPFRAALRDGVDPDRIIAGAEAYARLRTKRDQYIPTAARWLKEERWQDLAPVNSAEAKRQAAIADMQAYL